jgi:hypothetical protein
MCSFFHDRQLGAHLSLSFCIQFFKHCVSITLQCALVHAIERMIMLAKDACSRPPITVRSHNLHACDIRRALGEITSYHKRISSLPSLILVGCVSFGLSLTFPFVFHVMILTISFFYWIFFHLTSN